MTVFHRLASFPTGGSASSAIARSYLEAKGLEIPAVSPRDQLTHWPSRPALLISANLRLIFPVLRHLILPHPDILRRPVLPEFQSLSAAASASVLGLLQ